MPEILQTVDNKATTYKDKIKSIYSISELDRNVLKKTVESEQKKHMEELFKEIKNSGGKMTIVEENTAGTDKTDVVFRELVNGKLSGKSGIRLPHETEVSLPSDPDFKIGKDANNRNHVYIAVEYGGKRGYIASEHLSYKKEEGAVPPSEEKNTDPEGAVPPSEEKNTDPEGAVPPSEEKNTDPEGAVPPSEEKNADPEGAVPPSGKETAKPGGAVPPSGKETAKPGGAVPPSGKETASEGGVPSSGDESEKNTPESDENQQKWTEWKDELIKFVGGRGKMEELLAKRDNGEGNGFFEAIKDLEGNEKYIDKDARFDKFHEVFGGNDAEDIFKAIYEDDYEDGVLAPYLGKNAEKITNKPINPAPETNNVIVDTTNLENWGYVGFDQMLTKWSIDKNMITKADKFNGTEHKSQYKGSIDGVEFSLDEISFKNEGKIIKVPDTEKGFKEYTLKIAGTGNNGKNIYFTGTDDTTFTFTITE